MIRPEESFINPVSDICVVMATSIVLIIFNIDLITLPSESPVTRQVSVGVRCYYWASLSPGLTPVAVIISSNETLMTGLHSLELSN